MNRTVLLAFLVVLVVACVECQQGEGEECNSIFMKRCRTNEYCQNQLLSPFSYCMPYIGKGRLCGRIFGRCEPGLECRVNRNNFRLSTCQDPSIYSTSTSTSTTESTMMNTQ